MGKKIKKFKVGIDSETYAISMVEAPAMESDFVALAEQAEDKVQAFLESDERHMVYGAALIPDKEIYRNNGEQEYYISFTKESIEKMSQEFMKQFRQNEVTLDHEEMANDITITESWLVEDPYKDKANALGIDVPKGSWMVGMKVNEIDTWERVKNGELKGFSVESMISLEDFSKQNNTNMTDNEMLSKIKEMFNEFVASLSMRKKEEEVALETQEPTQEPVVEPAATEPTNEPTVEPTTEPTPTVVEPVVEPAAEPTQEPTEPKAAEEPKEPKATEDEHLSELIKNLKDEISALKEMNSNLSERVKELGKEPSVKPISTNGGKPNASDTYSAWREQMRKML